jgi:undecaprenyl-diphosphatase
MDHAVLEFAARHRTALLDTGSRHLMEVGTSQRALALLALAGVLLVVATRRWHLGLAVGVALVASSAIAQVLKDVIERPRPPMPPSLVYLGGFAMPSTHAARTAAIATAAVIALTGVTPLTRRIVGVAAGGAVVVVGLCMVYLGGHWLTDVLVGWALGVAVGAGAAWAAKTASARSVRVGGDQPDD